MNYQEFTTTRQKEYEKLTENTVFYAFNDKQFNEGLKKLNIEENEIKDKIVSIGAGGYALKTEAYKIHELFEKHDNKFKELMKDENFAVSAFDYELGNHEFTYTGNTSDAIESLGFTHSEIKKNKHLLKCLNKAIKLQWEWDKEHN